MSAGRRVALAAVIVAAAVSGMASTSIAKPPRLNAELRALVGMPGGPPGAIALVQRGGRLTVYRAGVSDLRSRAPMRPNDRMRLASTSKAFSGAVALALVDRGVLSLSDTVGRLLPGLSAKWNAVTLGEALQHTSGLPDFTASKTFISYLTKHLHARPSPRFLLRFVTGQRLRFLPGTRYRYSNTDNFIAALMAEAATHRSYNQLLSRYAYGPAGLGRTSLPAGAALPSPFTHGYEIAPGTPAQDVTSLLSAAYAWASGGMVSTPADLNRFARAYVGGRLFSRRTQAAQMQFVAAHSDPIGPGASSAGLAIFRYRTRCGTVYGHTGNTFGYTQFFAASRNGSRSVTVSINAQITQESAGKLGAAFRRLRAIEGDAVCAALS